MVVGVVDLEAIAHHVHNLLRAPLNVGPSLLADLSVRVKQPQWVKCGLLRGDLSVRVKQPQWVKCGLLLADLNVLNKARCLRVKQPQWVKCGLLRGDLSVLVKVDLWQQWI